MKNTTAKWGKQYSEGTIDSSKLSAACNGLGGTNDPAIIEFQEEPIWTVHAPEIQDMITQKAIMKKLVDEIIKEAHKCGKRDCHGNGNCKVNSQSW